MGANKKKVHVMKTRSESIHAYKERIAKLEPQDKEKRAKTVAALPNVVPPGVIMKG